jgi:hypothetical protein
MSGKLGIIYYFSLWGINFDAQEGGLVSDGIDRTSVNVSPHGDLIAYLGPTDVARNTLVVTDMAAEQPAGQIVIGSNSTVVAWSAGNEWLGHGELPIGEFAAPELYVSPTSGVQQASVLISEAALEMVFLEDNTLVYLERDADLLPAGLYHFDPENETSEALALDMPAAVNFTLLELEDELHAQGLDMVPTSFFGLADYTPEGQTRYHIRLPLEETSTLAVCEEWQVLESQPAEGSETVIYTAPDTMALTDIKLLPDGSVTFLQWRKAECDFFNEPVAELVQVWPDGEFRVLTDTVIADLTQVNVYVPRKPRYALSPDGRFVLWVSTLPAATTLEMLDLQTGAQARVGLESNVNGRLIFNGVVWVE